MGFFDKAREALGQAAAAVSRETEVLALQSQLGHTDTELDRVMVEVGKRARDLHRAGQLQDREMDVLMRRVVELEEQMMELRQKVQDAQARAVPVAPPVAAAPTPPPPPAEAARMKCPGCDAQVSPTATFCGECGAKIAQA